MKRVAAILLIACIGLLAVAWTTIRLSSPALNGAVALAGLDAAVEVARDEFGVPTITASSRRDLALATGFVHAQDRFFQMDLLRRVAAGELAELVGPAALGIDRNHRLHRFRAASERLLPEMPAGDRVLLDAYAQGVNAGLAALTVRPFEYLLLGMQPKTWAPEDTLLANYAMYLDLNDDDASRDASYGRMHETLAPELVNFLLPEGTPWDAPLIGAALAVPQVPGPRLCDLRQSATAARASTLTAGLDRFVIDEPMAGSNGWAVAGERSAGGRAIVANDMHLQLGVPNIWYRMRLVVEPAANDEEPLDITGVTLPGAPLVVAGSNGSVAWGFTNSYGDWSDLVVLEQDPTDARRYRTPGGWRELETHAETIRVRGEEPVTMQIESSVWGPVIDTDAQGRKRAIHWVAHEDEAANLRLIDLERAANVDTAVRIAHTVGSPPQNIMIADRFGDIAWTIMGRIPNRVGYDPRLPASWADAGVGWLGWLASDAYPVVTRPDDGVLWTANARTGNGDVLDAVGRGGYALGARAQQIRDRLATLERGSIDDMLAIQLDDRALVQQAWRDLLVGVLRRADDNGRRAQLLTVLERWDGRAATQSVGYRLAREFRRQTRETLLTDIVFGCGTATAPFQLRRLYQTEGAVWRLVTERPAHLLPSEFASWDEFLLSMADRAVATCETADLDSCVWGDVNRIEIRHPLARAVPLASRWLTVHAGPLPGGQHTPRVQDGLQGASERFAVSPGDEANGYFHMPGGQSGHPLSRYFSAGHDAWVRGERLPFLPGQAEHTLVLMPDA
jgi:penicillin amidase